MRASTLSLLYFKQAVFTHRWFSPTGGDLKGAGAGVAVALRVLLYVVITNIPH